MSAPEDKLKTTTITAVNVAMYLEDHPDFFNQYPVLLTGLELPHESGRVVSLVDKQVALLREQNRQTRRRLHELIEIARQNEDLARRLHRLTLRLMAADRPAALFKALYADLQENFQADRAAVRLFAEPAEAPHAAPEFAGGDAHEQALFEGMIAKRQPRSGPLQAPQRAFLFGDEADDLASAVMAPLSGAGWSGILAIASLDAERFQPGMGVDLLANLAELLSLILKPWIKAA